MAEKMTCTQCGMPCEAGEYHPYAACLMFTACHDSEMVRANLAQPAQAVDVGEIREVVAELGEQPFIDMDIDRRMVLADKLTHAIGDKT
jgi:hypothetical protein